jgi:uncharacterized protein (TIGR02145 family)
MNKTKRFLGLIPILLVLISLSVLQAQIPAAIDTKMKSDYMRNFEVEELKVRWKKAALENCPGVPCLAVTVPGSPTGVSATAGNAQVTVSFTVPSSTGGSGITGYTVTSFPGGITGTGSGSPITVTGLTNGTSYTFTVVAINAAGNSVASTASSSVTPAAPAPSFTCGTSTVSDIDGNSYNTVSMGTQCWLKENLRVGKYNDGTVIPLDATGGTSGNVSGEGWSGLSSGAKTVYEHNPVYLNALGYLYNAYAAIDPRGICPSGWKVPTISEWQTLETFLRVGSEVGHKMMVTTTPYGWNQPLKNNSLGFSALSSGSRIGFQYSGSTFHGKFTEAGVPGNTSTTFHAAWWSSTPVSSSTYINNANLEDGNLNNSLWLATAIPTSGMSIRCTKI